MTESFGSGDNAFTMDFVTIGNPNNPADTTGNPNPAGSVAYIYNIGKYEVSWDMINKASLGFSMHDMYYYGSGVSPALRVSWNEAARFVNYLNTSKNYQVAYNFTTIGMNDNITLWGDGQYNGNNQFRHKNAYYFLPSLDEWYKGAYGNLDGTWNNYPTGSDSAPRAVASGTAANTAVYNGQPGPADITSAGGLSPYGTMAQGGNVCEWNETAFDGTNNDPNEHREVRGGIWYGYSLSNTLDASYRSAQIPTDEAFYLGFRVASVPEPSTGLLVVLGLSGLLLKRRKTGTL